MTRQKILIVDDIEANLISLERVLAGLQVTVIRASSGNDALIAILNHDFALAIIDVQMPVMDGYELAEYIRGEKKTESLPVIFLSAVYSDEYHVFRGYESGAVDFMTKPFNPYYLIRKVEIFLELDRQKELLRESLKIEHSKNYLESVVGAISDSLIVIDLEGRITRANLSACRMLGFTPDEMSELSIRQFFRENTFSDWYRTITESGEACTPGKETVLIAKDGSEKPVILSGSMMKDNDGKINGAVLIAVDISERKKFEAGLIEAKERSEELSNLKSHFLRNMSHEIRTPLTGILGYTELLMTTAIDSDQKELLEKILLSGQRLGHTLNSILDLSKLESESFKTKPERTDLKEILEKIDSYYSSIAEDKGLGFKTVISADKTVAMIDPQLFRQVLNHLLDNAFKFTTAGSVKLHVSNRIRNGEYLIDIAVVDTGIGISEKNYKMIWEEFRQESEGMNRGYEGTGLGLTITKRFIEKMGGKIDLQSEKGKGSTFTLTLPAVQGERIPTLENGTDPVQENDRLQQSVDIKPKILYVEDEKLNRDLISFTLGKVAQLDAVASAEVALELASGNRYDGFLVDINLGPGMNGIELTKRLREMENYRDTPIIALTALALPGDKEMFLSQGCSHYLSKPFSSSELVKLIGDVVKPVASLA